MDEFKELLLVLFTFSVSFIGARIKGLIQSYKIKKFKLIDHPIFTDLTTSIQDLKGWTNVKNRQVFIDALEIKLQCWKIEGEILAEELQKGKYSNLQLQNKILRWASNTQSKYIEKWIKANIDQIVINRIIKIHDEKVQQFLQKITSTCNNNNMYVHQFQKIISIFDTLSLLLSDTKNDFNRLVYQEKYNGKFKNRKYKNIPINDDDYDKYLARRKK